MGSSRPQRVYLQNNYLYRFPVDYSDLLTTRCSNEDDRFNGSNSSGSLLLRNDAIADSELDFHRQHLKNAQTLGKKKHKQKPKYCNLFNRLALCLLAFLLCLGVFFYWSMWLVKVNSTCNSGFEEPTWTNSTKFNRVSFFGYVWS